MGMDTINLTGILQLDKTSPRGRANHQTRRHLMGLKTIPPRKKVPRTLRLRIPPIVVITGATPIVGAQDLAGDLKVNVTGEIATEIEDRHRATLQRVRMGPIARIDLGQTEIEEEGVEDAQGALLGKGIGAVIARRALRGKDRMARDGLRSLYH